VDKRSIIMDHYTNPINKRDNDDPKYIKANTRNESCIDNLDIYVLIENNIIKDITFNGEACAISISSASIMIKNLIGKSVVEAKEYIKNFEAMLDADTYNNEILNEAIVYSDTKNTSRSTCARLPYDGIRKILDNF